MKVRDAAFLVATLLAAGPAAGHGLGARFDPEASATVVEFYYIDGSAMAYGEARAFSPRAPETPFANGRADALGRFAFVPDAPGTWRVEGKDSEGHQVSVTVAVGGEAATASRWRQPRTWLLIVSLALNVALAGVWFERRRPAPA